MILFSDQLHFNRYFPEESELHYLVPFSFVLEEDLWITASTVVQAVLKVNSQSNEEWQILIPCDSKTSERISVKLHYVTMSWM